MKLSEKSRTSIASSRPSKKPLTSVNITHPDRLVFPELGLTKGDIANYYEAVAPRMLPHLRDRPLTLVFCPKGVDQGCQYLRHSKVWGPKAIRRIRIREKTKIGEYMIADTREALLSLAQMNVLEVHTWNSTADHIEKPNRIVLDLDPGEKVQWEAVIAAARLIRSMLAELKLKSWVKTTGGRGLHVVVPIVPERDWSVCLEYARQIATVAVEQNAALYTTDFRKQGREDKILIDYLRNNRTNTSISAFSVRARQGAPVSMPIDWNDLRPSHGPERFTVKTSVAYLKRQQADPWRDYWRIRQRLP
jgi:bifunctional non-homologous end joining protein LigD